MNGSFPHSAFLFPVSSALSSLSSSLFLSPMTNHHRIHHHCYSISSSCGMTNHHGIHHCIHHRCYSMSSACCVTDHHRIHYHCYSMTSSCCYSISSSVLCPPSSSPYVFLVLLLYSSTCLCPLASFLVLLLYLFLFLLPPVLFTLCLPRAVTLFFHFPLFSGLFPLSCFLFPLSSLLCPKRC